MGAYRAPSWAASLHGPDRPASCRRGLGHARRRAVGAYGGRHGARLSRASATTPLECASATLPQASTVRGTQVGQARCEAHAAPPLFCRFPHRQPPAGPGLGLALAGPGPDPGRTVPWQRTAATRVGQCNTTIARHALRALAVASFPPPPRGVAPARAREGTRVRHVL